MARVDAAVFEHVEGLPEHRRVLTAILGYFRTRAVAGWVSGSVAAGGVDAESDLDVGICFTDASARDAAWTERWDWRIAPWYHRFDADHVRPHFVIYHFDPGSRTVPPHAAVDWSPAIHEEERLWAWLVYSLQHVRRGEYYSIASDFAALRDVVEQWQARLEGRARFQIRRAERLVDTTELAELFPGPDRDELTRALLKLVAIHDRQRAQVDLPWRTTEEARTRIRRWIEEL